MSTGEREDGPQRDDMVELVRRGLQGLEQIVAERDALRARIRALEGAGVASGGPSDAAGSELSTLRQQMAALEDSERQARARAQEAEVAAHSLQTRVAELEDESNNLANLYIAGHQLYGAVRFRDVVQVVSEIVINLVGVHRFALYMLDPPTQTLHPLLTEGYASAPSPAPVGGADVVGRVAASRTRHAGAAAEAPLLALPLLANGRLVGVLVIDELLRQKSGFSAVDQELFTLLCDHGGTALRAAFLRERSGQIHGDTPWTFEELRQSLAR